ncbi:MAG: hypothetical protein EPN69_03015 [Rhodanobacter sp.]|nr:MAG: hypothetical protein EPN71_09470 [Rhodanobacter sp.]TAL97579.1 MAG: hypothetical protein EPN69_03015 [Rhodanobacter sp.]TAM38113.1 MAG: hypothetical protein EPN58_17895 [Rhodanobacter sp.]TAN22894.1 MAG: hypothetical protein EPN32_12320 [Rhodanobacter sp.]
MSHVSPGLYVSLAEIVPDLHVHCVDPWCLIGSTAALLLGAKVSADDVHVLTSRADADALMAQWSERRVSGSALADSDRLRSHFARFSFPGVPVEVLGGLELHTDNGWQVVQPGRLVLAGLNGLAVPVPCIEDQIRLFESFGREKDLRRAAALRALGSRTSIPPILSFR